MTYDINIYFRTTFYKKKYYIYENTYFTHTDIHYNPSSLFVLKMFFLLLSPLSSLSKFNVFLKRSFKSDLCYLLLESYITVSNKKYEFI